MHTLTSIADPDKILMLILQCSSSPGCMLHVDNKGANQPVHICSLIRALVVCFIESIIV